jgi:phage baseplate assembly protein gpV
MVFADSAESPSRVNWLAGAQYNTDNGWELTPSTANGGYTFTNRVLTAYANGDLTVNENGIDANFRVETSGNENMLFVDGGGNAVGIGTATPTGTLHVDKDIASGANYGIIQNDGAANTNTIAGWVIRDGSSIMSGIRRRRDGGTSPTEIGNFSSDEAVFFLQNNESCLQLNGDGSIVFNEDALDKDFRVESDTLTSALFVDGGTGNVTMQGATTTIGSEAASTNVQLILNGVASKAQRIKFAESGVDKWLLGQGAASETSAFELYNAGGVMALSVDRTTNVATFASGAVFNEDSADSDFRVESDNLANALFIEGSNGEVTFGKNTFDVATVGVGIRGATGESFCSISTGNTLHVYDTSAGTFRFYVNVNGGISNYSANNINLSDEREKKNVEALPSQWDCLKHWDLKQFHYNADDDALPKKYGVIAQEIEAHCPEVIDVFKVDEDTERMGVKEQQMMWMAIKALQEAQTRIESLESRIAALES